MAVWKKLLTTEDVKTSFSGGYATYDYGSDFTALNTAGKFSGEVVRYGLPISMTAGKIYALSGTWALADKDTVAHGQKQLAVAAGNSTNAIPTSGMMINGVVRVPTINGTGGAGDVLYLGDDGEVTYDAPTDAGDIVRPVGYCVNDTNKIIYFNPDKTWVELS